MVDAGPEPTYSEINEGTPLGGRGGVHTLCIFPKLSS